MYQQPQQQHQNLVKGDGLIDFLNSIPRRVKGLIYGATEAPQSLKRLLEKHGNERIVYIRVCREPIQGTINSFLNFISLGKLEELKRNMNYDNIVHLFAYVKTDAGTGFKIEKNQIVKVSYDEPAQNIESVLVPVFDRPTLNTFFSKALQMTGPSLWVYDVLKSNCQKFIRDLLLANGLLTPKIEEFIQQDASAIVGALPTGFAGFARGLTDIAARFDIGILGRGRVDKKNYNLER